MPTPAPASVVETAAVAGEGGPAAAVTPALERALLDVVVAARPEAVVRMSAFNLDLGRAAISGEVLRVRAWLDRATRSLAFAGAEALSEDGARLASAAAVFELREG